MFTAIERLHLDRDFMEVEGKACCTTGIRINVTLYKLSDTLYHLIRAHYNTTNLCGLVPTCSETETDFIQDYEDLDEGLRDFNTQCVKAFTQQMTWHTSRVESVKELNSEHRTTSAN